MKDWQGIRQDSDATAEDGAWFVANALYEIEGEVGRRPGTSIALEESGVVISTFWSPMSGFQVVLAKDDGSLVVETPP